MSDFTKSVWLFVLRIALLIIMSVPLVWALGLEGWRAFVATLFVAFIPLYVMIDEELSKVQTANRKVKEKRKADANKR